MARSPQDASDWKLATWDGAKRETLRRWAALPLEEIIAALEEMDELNEQLRTSDGDHPGNRRRVGAAHASGVELRESGSGGAADEHPAGGDADHENDLSRRVGAAHASGVELRESEPGGVVAEQPAGNDAEHGTDLS